VLGTVEFKNMLPMQTGDVNQTFADTSALEKEYAYKPKVVVKEGIIKFVSWYKDFYFK